MAQPKTLIAGGAGYLGQTLAKILIDSGRKVTVLDNLLFGPQPELQKLDLTFVQGDIRDIGLVRATLEGHQEAILLAALVGEPLCDQRPKEALEVNYLAALNFAQTAKALRVNRFIFASTDSCYGQREKEILTELSPLAPISLYARLKAESETAILKLGSSLNFHPTILRMATIYGLAPRPRFDLAINLLAREATLSGAVKIFSGEQWRPLVHVKDAAKAYLLALKAPLELVSREIFNVGSNEQNIQFKDLAALLAQTFPAAKVEITPEPPDLRDYYVDFYKIKKVLGFTPEFTPKDAFIEIKNAILGGLILEPRSKRYQNVGGL
ncbi:MAG: NAD(P)-dependent oxidoreductase [Deltaproteobacteria bacterium]|jgi:nucleoside-diphosphate-sugar epimerase|nr:NAD(P)-dependent oxidoreductase [Deltaproteobacteria bacterium]